MKSIDKSLPDLILKDAKHGKGVFAGRKFKAGEMIIEFKGNFMTYEEQADLCLVEDRYVQVGHNLFMGPSGDIDDYINHSCNPNAALIIPAGDAVRGGVALIALREINEDEEITFDYSTTMDEDDWEMDCGCGSEKCRKRIRDFKYLPEDTQEKYIRLGIVPDYIMKKLKNAIGIKE
ncbi:MAG: SET domain-containing protein-lysine N-methyltransferase [Proteobacteria bacterium]|nr:SET domain-containing protein-lysine N-methyltransferase [Pseudomonadota bacterium]